MITLSINSRSVQPGDTFGLDVSIASTGGDQCSAIQFTVSHSTLLNFTDVHDGAQIIAAGKALSRSGDQIVIFGLNTNVITNGVIATLTFRADPAAPAAIYPVAAAAIVASDANANPLGTASVSGAVTVGTPSSPTLVIACPAATTATVGVPYVGGFAVGGGTPPYNVTLPSGMLPPGLTLDAPTGLFLGTPISPGMFSFTGQVEDSLGAIATT